MAAEDRPAARIWLWDVLAVLVLIAIVSACAVHVLRVARYPEEDAAMLLRYAQHLSQGHGIVWNLGEKPIDGATDFLYLLAVAGGCRTGLSVEDSARAVGLAAHILTVLVIYAALRRAPGAAPILAALAAAYLAAGPGLYYVAAGFGTTLFTLAVALAWWAAVRLAAAGQRVGAPTVAFGLASLLMGLARPEGVFLAVFILGAVLLARRGSEAPRIVAGFAYTFGLLGLGYFLWRWSYFGHPLPNPFYRRGGGMVHVEVLGHALRNVMRMGGPFLPLLAAGLFLRRTRGAALMAFIPVVLFTLLWVLFSDEANYFMRYRYPVLPIVLMGAVPVAQGLSEVYRERRAAAALVALAAWAIVALVRVDGVFPMEVPRMGLYDVATRLAAWRGRGYTLVTTEAGLLPLYSEWTSIDAWGLNDAWIAQHGTVTAEYLDRAHPDVIMFHAYFTPEARARQSGKGLGPQWSQMTTALERYAKEHDFRLAAVYEKSRTESHYYYVRRGLIDEAAVVAAIHLPDYEWDARPAADVTPAL
jgi:arabinofuranosyltransferase